MTKVGSNPIFTHRNDGSSAFSLWLERWAEQYDVPPGSEIVVRGRGPSAGEAEIDQFANGATIYAPLGSLVDVLIDGVVRNGEWASSTMSIPASASLGSRQLIDLLFGAFPEARPGGAPIAQSRWREWLRKIWPF